MTDDRSNPESERRETSLQALVRLRDQLQRLRIAEGNRERASLRGILQRAGWTSFEEEVKGIGGITDLVTDDLAADNGGESRPGPKRVRITRPDGKVVKIPEGPKGITVLRELVAEATQLEPSPIRGLRQADQRAEFHQEILKLEEKVESQFRGEVEEHIAWPWISRIRGVGPALAAQILSDIDFTVSSHPSSLWRFAGLAVVDGKADRAHKGEKRTYNGRLKTVMYRWAVNQLKNNGPYEQIYRDARHRYSTMRPNWTEAHRHLAALRKAEKLFLCHLHCVVRQAMGLPVSKPFVIANDVDGLHTYIDPWEMVTPDGKSG